MADKSDSSAFAKLEASWHATARQSAEYLRSIASISARLTRPAGTPTGVADAEVLLQQQHLKTLEVVMKALWRNQDRLDQYARKLERLAAEAGSNDAVEGMALAERARACDMGAARLKVALQELRYENPAETDALAAAFALAISEMPAAAAP